MRVPTPVQIPSGDRGLVNLLDEPEFRLGLRAVA